MLAVGRVWAPGVARPVRRSVGARRLCPVRSGDGPNSEVLTDLSEVLTARGPHCEGPHLEVSSASEMKLYCPAMHSRTRATFYAVEPAQRRANARHIEKQGARR